MTPPAPEDPPLNEAALLADLGRRDTEADTRHFVLWGAGTIVASAAVRLPLADNTHLAYKGSGQLIAFTELFWDPQRPSCCFSGLPPCVPNTAVIR